MAKYKIPQLLLQINMAFNYDGSFGEYEAFVVSIEDFTYTFLRAVASPQYIRSLRGQPANSGKDKVRIAPDSKLQFADEYEILTGSSWSSEQWKNFHVERIGDVLIDRFFARALA